MTSKVSIRARWSNACLNQLLLGVFFAILLPEVGAQSGAIEFDPMEGAVIVSPEKTGEWFRLERTNDFETWLLARDSIAWPSRVSIGSLEAVAEFYRFVAIPSPEGPFRIGVVGDSTAVGIQSIPQARGWAQELAAFTSGDTKFVMAGNPGLSTKTFAGSFQELTLERTEPQIVMVQLGQIDEFTRAVEEKGTTVAEYRENLKQIVSFIRGWGGTPILVSPLPSRELSGGMLVPHLAERSAAVRGLAHESGVYVIELNRLVTELYARTEPSELGRLGYGDLFHLSVAGAKSVARIVHSALPGHLRDLLFVELNP